jgi:tripartite-type tricarboxylate transporter receptor subunit TctC
VSGVYKYDHSVSTEIGLLSGVSNKTEELIMAMNKRKPSVSQISLCAVIFTIAWLFSLSLADISVAGQAGKTAKYPISPIKIIVPAAAGGSLGSETRLIAPFFEKNLGVSIVVEYVAGADGMIAYNKFPQEKANGYSLLSTNTLTSIFLELTRDSAKYSVKNYTAVGGWNVKYQVLVSHPDTWKSFADFLSDGKKRNITVAGAGGSTILNSHILGESLGIKFTVVPFKSSGEGLAAVAGKHVDCMLTFESTPKPMIQAGKLKALAVLSSKPDPILPGVPNLKELGHAEVPTLPSVGIIAAPPNTSREIVAVLEKALGKAIAAPEFVKIADNVGIYLDYLPAAELNKIINEQYGILNKYKAFIK